MVMQWIAWSFVALPFVIGVYAYALYPAILWVIGRVHPSPTRQDVPDPAPMVTIVLPAYNEEHQIRGAIEALLAQDYPVDRRQILIVSDGSNDRTELIVQEYQHRGVELLRMPKRSGKTAAENASVALIRGEIVINSDASIRLHPSATRLLVAQFADPGVGVASSRDVSISRQTESSNTTEAGYVGYEMWVRDLETYAGGIVGASGSGYAIRAELHSRPVRHDLSRDFSSALTARRHGYRAVSVTGAICYVPRTASLKAEYRRKVRTISRGMETLLFNRSLLDPIEYGAFSWKLISHKVCRWAVSLSFIPFVIGLLLLAPRHPWAYGVIAGGVLLGAFAAAGAAWPEGRPMPRPLSILAFAVAANLAVINAAWRVLHGHDDHVWEPTRRAPSPASDVNLSNDASAS
jgi:cellulose synthase/poly-beta-1,6-N-acetylglucosamine synthase-like glycosyltransferase